MLNMPGIPDAFNLINEIVITRVVFNVPASDGQAQEPKQHNAEHQGYATSKSDQTHT